MVSRRRDHPEKGWTIYASVVLVFPFSCSSRPPAVQGSGGARRGAAPGGRESGRRDGRSPCQRVVSEPRPNLLDSYRDQREHVWQRDGPERVWLLFWTPVCPGELESWWRLYRL